MSSLAKYLRAVWLRLTHIDRWRLLGTAALVCALCLTLVSAAFAYISIARMHAAFDWVSHTNHVILQIATIEKNLLSADSSVRAQALSGGKPDHNTAQRANDVIKAEVIHLAALVADNPEQTERIQHLQATIAKRGEVAINRERSEFRQLTAIRVEIGEMQRQEHKLLKDRAATLERATLTALLLAVVTGLLALILGTLGIYLLTKERLQRRHIELELMRIQRLNMMSLTTMALAHEINQPLAAASNYLSCSMRLAQNADADLPGKIVDMSMRAQEQVQRAAKIIKRLRNFIQKSEDERTAEDPGVIIDDAISLIGTIDSTIKVETNIEPDLPVVSIDRIQLQQVLINLIRNSIEAIDGSKRGILILSVTALDATHVRFSVTDNGPGMPKKVQENLFKAFESNKAGGMGVGLMICKAIITAHGGQIAVANGPGGGTTISFTLPAMPQQMAA